MLVEAGPDVGMLAPFPFLDFIVQKDANPNCHIERFPNGKIVLILSGD